MPAKSISIASLAVEYRILAFETCALCLAFEFDYLNANEAIRTEKAQSPQQTFCELYEDLN